DLTVTGVQTCALPIYRQVQQMARLLDDLLDVARINRGRIELRTKTVDAALIVRRTAEATQSVIQAQSHGFDVKIDDEPLTVDAEIGRASGRVRVRTGV